METRKSMLREYLEAHGYYLPLLDPKQLEKEAAEGSKKVPLPSSEF